MEGSIVRWVCSLTLDPQFTVKRPCFQIRGSA